MYDFIYRSIHSVAPLKALYTCSFRHQLEISGKHSSHAAITREDIATAVCRQMILIYTAAAFQSPRANGAHDFEVGKIPVQPYVAFHSRTEPRWLIVLSCSVYYSYTGMDTTCTGMGTACLYNQLLAGYL